MAACRGEPLSIFFPERGETGEKAKVICRKCPVIAECLDWALGNADGSRDPGVYGGTTAYERRFNPALKARARRIRSEHKRESRMAFLHRELHETQASRRASRRQGEPPDSAA